MKLVSINIEGDIHLDRVTPYLQSEAPDVICLQEVYEQTLTHIAKLLNKQAFFVPHLDVAPGAFGRAQQSRWGIGMLAPHAGVVYQHMYYYRPSENLHVWQPGDDNVLLNDASWRGLIVAAIDQDDGPYTIATTHFTWTPDGVNSPRQSRDLDRMMQMLEEAGPLVVCGDFNIPRGTPLWERLKLRYRDNIPTQVISTLDPELHRAQGVNVVVDALFSSDAYNVSEVQVVPGISDHQVIVATIGHRVIV